MQQHPDWTRVSFEIGVPPEALAFFYEVVDAVTQSTSNPPGTHCTAAEFCSGFLRYAHDRLGSDYRKMLRSWQIHTSEDLGGIVYELIDRGLMQKTESDQQMDFAGQFDLRTPD